MKTTPLIYDRTETYPVIKLMKIAAIFDNEGETLDRYTVIFDNGDMLGLSEYGCGFSQWCGNCVDDVMFCEYGYSWRRHCNVKRTIKHRLPGIIDSFDNIGKRVTFESLSPELQTHIKERSYE